jgi:hypothetical protein
MSAAAYTHRIKVQTQARNAKVQYPGGRAQFTPLNATCAANPIFTVIDYVGIPIGCSTTLGGACITNPPPTNNCIPAPNAILDGGNSVEGEFVIATCILDGGYSNSNYTPVLSGGNSSS